MNKDQMEPIRLSDCRRTDYTSRPTQPPHHRANNGNRNLQLPPNPPTAVDNLTIAFCALDGRNFPTLEAYQQECKTLMAQLRHANCAPDDRAACWTVLTGMRPAWAKQYQAFYHEMVQNKLTFDILVARLASRVGYIGDAHLRCGIAHEGGDEKCPVYFHLKRFALTVLRTEEHRQELALKVKRLQDLQIEAAERVYAEVKEKEERIKAQQDAIHNHGKPVSGKYPQDSDNADAVMRKLGAEIEEAQEALSVKNNYLRYCEHLKLAKQQGSWRYTVLSRREKGELSYNHSLVKREIEQDEAVLRDMWVCLMAYEELQRQSPAGGKGKEKHASVETDDEDFEGVSHEDPDEDSDDGFRCGGPLHDDSDQDGVDAKGRCAFCVKGERWDDIMSDQFSGMSLRG
jgi:hypothetical protein